MNKFNFYPVFFVILSIVISNNIDAAKQVLKEEDPPVAVVIKTPPGMVKKRPKVVKKPMVCPKCEECQKCQECPACQVCPECQPVCQDSCCPAVEECALTVPEALSYKDDFNLFFALALNKQRSVGLNSAGLESWLTSPFSLGFMIGADYYFTEHFSVYTNYSFTKMGFDDTQPGIILLQDENTASKLMFGARYRFSEYFTADAHLGVKQDFTLYSDVIPYAIADRFWHGLFGAGLGYHIWDNRRVAFDGITGMDVYFPNTKALYKSNLGFAINTELKTTFKYKPEFFISFRYEYFRLGLSNFEGQSGHFFAFNFGVNLRTKMLRSDFWNRS